MFTSILFFRKNKEKEGHLALVCDFCGKTFRYTSVLRRHVLNDHTEVRMHKCELCDFETNNKDNYLGKKKLPPTPPSTIIDILVFSWSHRTFLATS